MESGSGSVGSAGPAARSGGKRRRAELCAGLFGPGQARPDEILFTSCATESNNTAVFGTIAANPDRRHIVTTGVEHPAIFSVGEDLQRRGFEVSFVPVDSDGQIDRVEFVRALRDETLMVSVMHANNEVGTLQPVAEIAARAQSRGILSHSDCAQSTGKIPVILAELGVDMISVAGHKLYGPKGVGLLCLREGVEIPNLMFGAPHEGGRRPGTRAGRRPRSTPPSSRRESAMPGSGSPARRGNGRVRP